MGAILVGEAGVEAEAMAPKGTALPSEIIGAQKLLGEFLQLGIDTAIVPDFDLDGALPGLVALFYDPEGMRAGAEPELARGVSVIVAVDDDVGAGGI